MATVYGLTTTGLVIKTLLVIRAEIDAAVRAGIGSSLPLGDRTLLGQSDAILADRENSVWQLIEALYSCLDPDKATGAALDAICLLSGTLRPGAAFSTDSVLLTGSNGTVVPSGSIASTTSTGQQFQTLNDSTLATVTTWVSGTYAVGDLVTESDSVDFFTATDVVFYCSSAVTGATRPDADPSHWILVGKGTAAVAVDTISLQTGPIQATAGDLTTIVTGIGGWLSVYNVFDAVLGRNIATDEELRLLREAEIAAPGTSPLDAIRADILALTGVTTCTVFENVTDTTDGAGVPPHAIEVLVQGGDDQTIANQIFASVAAGINTYTSDTTSKTVVDSQGTDHTINFSRPTPHAINVAVTLTYDVNVYPADGDMEIATAIANAGNAKLPGTDAVSSAIVAACFSVPGVLDVSSAFLALNPTSPTTTTTLPMTLRDLATWTTMNITVNSSPGTP